MDHELLVLSHMNGPAGKRRSTGRITTAAVRPSIVVLALVSSGAVCTEPAAAWLILAVLMAAFVIRRVLVSAAITLLGEACGSARRLLGHRPSDPGERYRIDPQFALRVVERAT
jgi:uncharacterized membrane protein YdfJ with MMPL/SSD domain